MHAFAGLGPVLYLNHQYSALVTLIHVTELPRLLEKFNFHNVLVFPGYFGNFLRNLAERFPRTILSVVAMACGINERLHIKPELMPVMGRHEPGGTSTQNLQKWMQTIERTQAQFLDFGSEEENMKHYNQTEPPLYPVENIKANMAGIPMLLIRGENDYFVEERDFNKLVALLPTERLDIKVVPDYAHLDYVWADDAKQFVFDDVVEHFERIVVERNLRKKKA